MRFTLPLLTLLILSGCAQKPEEAVAEAVDLAQTYLSSDQCQKAIDVLEDVGRQNENAVYLQALASAYACRAGFSEIDFLSADLPNLSSSSAGLLNSLASFSESYESEADSSAFRDMQTAIDILLEADGGLQPSQAARNSFFGSRKAGDLGLQLLFMGIYQFGKFLNFYGNVNAAGAKGLGAASTDEQGATPSTCFLEYTYPDALAYVQSGGAPGGICNNMASDDGHPDLPLGLASTNTRLCQGLMIFNNVLDTLENVTVPDNPSMGDLADVAGTVDDFKQLAISADPALETLLTTTSQSVCETLLGTPAQLENMQLIYALIFETGL